MKVVHWTFGNGSGLDRIAKDICDAEKSIGIDSVLVNSNEPSQYGMGMDTDFHCIHSHLPDAINRKKSKLIWFAHGTPEHTFQTAVECGLNRGYGASDPFMLAQYWIRNADAIVTFWDRHAEILASLAAKNAHIELIPMGIDTSFWKPVESLGKYAGNPSLLTAENCHYIKWPLDLLILWPWVTKTFMDACLHVFYLPKDQHRWFFPLINANGAAFKSFVTSDILHPNDLRNAFVSCDYYVNLVRYGDFNKIGLEAKSAGCKVISYRGNDYADYWITEGDQRIMTREIIDILSGKTEARTTRPVVDIKDTAMELQKLYEALS